MLLKKNEKMEEMKSNINEFKDGIKSMKKFLILFASIVVVVILGSLMFVNISNGNKNKINTQEYNVLVTTQIGYEFTKNILDEKDNVNLLTREQDEFGNGYEVTPKNLRELRMADVIIYCGDEAEPWLKDTLEHKIKDNSKILINMCIDMKPEKLYDDENLINYMDYDNINFDNIKTQREGSAKNDYVFWTNPNNSLIILDKLYENLSALNTQYVDAYYNNYINYRNKINELTEKYNALKPGIVGKTFICSIENLSPYFINDLDLKYMNIFNKNEKIFEKNKSLLSYYIEKISKDVIVYCDEKQTDTVKNIVRNENVFVIYNMIDHNKDFSYIDLMNENILFLKKI